MEASWDEALGLVASRFQAIKDEHGADALAGFARVTAIDVKGFGLTEKPKDGQYHEAAYVAHVLAAMDAARHRLTSFLARSSELDGFVVGIMVLWWGFRVSTGGGRRRLDLKSDGKRRS